MISAFAHDIDNGITIRDEESIKKYIDLIQWGRAHPVQFVEQILEIPLMDYQKYILSMSWTAEYGVWVCSRNAGKSFLIGVISQARALLYPKSKILLLSSVSRQADETFQTMEDIATNKVKTLLTNNTVFNDEVFVNFSNSSGYIHDPKKGSKVTLLNGSYINAVTGTEKTVRGKRSNVNIYDEAGSISREFFDVTEPFCTQSSDFKLGAQYSLDIYPREIPNLRLYVGSASDTSTLFWDKYCEAFKQMLIGNEKYFVVDLNCEIPLAPTMNGKPIKPLLSRDEVERKMRENELTAMREYYNIFDDFNEEDSVVSRVDIYSNTENYVPELGYYEDPETKGPEKYIITYDPSSRNDNAPVLITKIFKQKDEKTGEMKYCGRFVNLINLVKRFSDGSKKPMVIEEQVQKLREIIYEYNGRSKFPLYDNVTVLLDGGIGGQSSAIMQELVKPWKYKGIGPTLPGFCDEESEFMVAWAENFPTAVTGCLRVLEPRKYRSAFFEAARVMISSGNMKFPPVCPKTSKFVLDSGEEKTLTSEEMASLIQMDLMKEEMVAMVRTKNKTSGTFSYGLPTGKITMHDDRNFVAIMACWQIQQLNVEEVFGNDEELDYMGSFINSKDDNNQKVEKKKEKSPWDVMMGGSSQRKNNSRSPFSGKNPFGRY